MARSPRSTAAVATLALVAAFATRPASATPALVVDIDSGRVLHAEQATDPWFPASITKLMTTYVVLSEIRAGRLTLDTPLIVSARATSVIPSKMGFKPGTEVTVDNALKMLMVKSANDMAVLLAEGAGGTVEGFADMMNSAAQRLGMRESHFVNPNGLPDERQQTSARDMAVLARALLQEFPQYQGYFGIGAIKFGKRVMQNTNGLIGRYPGADGMKTGFICASGFNVVATATRNGRRLVAVVLGSPNATSRTIKAADLFDKGFSGFSGWTGPLLTDLQASPAAAPPDMRDEVCGPHRRAVGEDDSDVGAPVNASAAGAGGDQIGFLLSQTPAANAFGNTVRGAKAHTLGPRAKAVPTLVYVGRAPGSSAQPPASMLANAVPAGGKGKTPANAQAFAPSDAAARGAPVALQGALQKPVKTKPADGGKAKTGTTTAGPATAKATAKGDVKTAPKADPKADPKSPAKTTAKPATTSAAQPAAKPAAKPAPTPKTTATTATAKPASKPKAADE